MAHRTQLRAVLTELCNEAKLSAPTFTAEKKLTDEVVAGWATRQASGEPGQVRCGRVHRGMKAEDIPNQAGYIPIYVSKGKGALGTAVSPFTLPFPLELYSKYGLTVHSLGASSGKPEKLLPQRPVELVWQAGKRADSETLTAYLQRRQRIYQKGEVKRRYLERGQMIKGAMFGGECLAYVPSRRVYYEAYSTAVGARKEFKFLKSLVEKGVNLLLLGPDGHELGDTLESVKAAYANPSAQFGHERVLVAMLRGYTLESLLPDAAPAAEEAAPEAGKSAEEGEKEAEKEKGDEEAKVVPQEAQEEKNGKDEVGKEEAEAEAKKPEEEKAAGSGGDAAA
eukprot:TRINITY_DN3427_c2_g2_i1.p1 TRINITY_DN3427_c2_g2~~TRINITY_DN3427_c2_g2_i1.p1  ORF type:complete len:338 (+),score=148.24 TRINITY_DN3427_c2_g2_i1:36-1049(+)